MVVNQKMYESLAGRTVRLTRSHTVEEDCSFLSPFKFTLPLPKGLSGTVLKVVVVPVARVFVEFSLGETKIQCWVRKELTELVK